MNRLLALASGVAVLIALVGVVVSAGGFLDDSGSDAPASQAPVDRRAPSRPERARTEVGGDAPRSRDRVIGAAGSRVAEDAASPRPGSRVAGPAPVGSEDTEATTGERSLSGRGARERSRDGRGEADGEGRASGRHGGTTTLRGEALTRALATALDQEDLATIQGLLISGLTREGTHLTAGDLPALFDILVGVDDFGLQNLVLTHLERLEAPPQMLVSGYLDYLEGARRPEHADTVFDRIAGIGGEPAVQGLSDFLRPAEGEKWKVRAARALADTRDPAAVPAIREALHGAQDPRQTRPYLESLARLGGREAVGILIDYGSREGHLTALKALAGLEDPEAGPWLAGSLTPGESTDFQKVVIRKLGQIADPRTLPELERYLGRAEASRQRDVVSALGQFSDPAAIRILRGFAAASDSAGDRRLAQLALREASRVEKNIARAAATARD